MLFSHSAKPTRAALNPIYQHKRFDAKSLAGGKNKGWIHEDWELTRSILDQVQITSTCTILQGIKPKNYGKAMKAPQPDSFQKIAHVIGV